MVLLRHGCSSLLRLAYRDIGGSDPERMAAPRVADYVQELFSDSPVKVGQTHRVMSANRNTHFPVGRDASTDRKFTLVLTIFTLQCPLRHQKRRVPN